MTAFEKAWIRDHKRDYPTFLEAMRTPLPGWFAQEHKRYLKELYEC